MNLGRKGKFSDEKGMGNSNEAEGKNKGKGESTNDNVRFAEVENDSHRNGEISLEEADDISDEIELIPQISEF